jgi:carbon-monoxide dehydrogenase large subunit
MSPGSTSATTASSSARSSRARRSAEYDAASGRFTFHVGSQGVFGMRNNIASDVLGVPPDKVHVLTGNVGGSFGMKSAVYPEYACVLHGGEAAGPAGEMDRRALGQLPVSDQHGRDHELVAELALDKQGKFLAVRVTGVRQWAPTSGRRPMPDDSTSVKNIADVYAHAADGGESKMRRHQHHADRRLSRRRAARGQLLHGAADRHGGGEMGIDRHRAAPPQPHRAGADAVQGAVRHQLRQRRLPPRCSTRRWRSPTGTASPARKAESKARGKLRGRGIGSYLEVTAPAERNMGGIRFEPDGTVTMLTGTLDYGQGHLTPFAQVLTGLLGVPFDRIKLVQGDSDRLIAGGGTGGSRSITMAAPRRSSKPAAR